MELLEIIKLATNLSLPVLLFIIWFYDYKMLRNFEQHIKEIYDASNNYKKLLDLYHSDIQAMIEKLDKGFSKMFERMARIEEKVSVSHDMWNELISTLKANVEVVSELKEMIPRKRRK